MVKRTYAKIFKCKYVVFWSCSIVESLFRQGLTGRWFLMFFAFVDYSIMSFVFQWVWDDDQPQSVQASTQVFVPEPKKVHASNQRDGQEGGTRNQEGGKGRGRKDAGKSWHSSQVPERWLTFPPSFLLSLLPHLLRDKASKRCQTLESTNTNRLFVFVSFPTF